MQQQFSLGSFFLLALWGLAVNAQTPAPDLDSITEDAYRRMLARQKLEGQKPSYPIFQAPTYHPDRREYGIETVPSPRGNGIFGYVVDPNDLIDADAEQRINQVLYGLEQTVSVEVAVVVLPSIGSRIPKDFAGELFEKWGMGQSHTGNGLLILTVINRHRTEFEVGQGLESTLTDAVCYRIEANEIVPRFRKGDYSGGIEKSVMRIGWIVAQPEAIDKLAAYGLVLDDPVFECRWYHWVLIICGLIGLLLGFWYFGQNLHIQRTKDD